VPTQLRSRNIAQEAVVTQLGNKLSAFYGSQSANQTPLSRIVLEKLKKKLNSLSPRANYTDRATAASRSTFADKGCHVVSVTDPYGRIFGFLDRSRYFSIK
jgi:hypothetical protein